MTIGVTTSHGVNLVAGLLTFCMAVGCSSPPRSSRLQTDDFVATASEMSASLAASDFLADRSPTSEPIVLSLQKTENLSTDVISEAEQWYLVERVFDTIPIRQLRDHYSIRVVRPADHIRASNRDLYDDVSGRMPPTHTLTATFRTMLRSGNESRTDTYGCRYEVIDLTSGEVVWSDLFEFKRSAFGRSWD